MVVACLTPRAQRAMLREEMRAVAAQEYAEHCAAVRAARMPNPVLAASIDRILAERPEVEPVIVRALEGYPHFD